MHWMMLVYWLLLWRTGQEIICTDGWVEAMIPKVFSLVLSSFIFDTLMHTLLGYENSQKHTKNPSFIQKFTIWKSQFSQDSNLQNLIFLKIHNFKILFFLKFAIWKSHYSHFENLIFYKVPILKISFFTKFTFSKSHFSQNSQF